MPNYPYIPGAPATNNLLMKAAIRQASNDTPENFIGPIVAPDTEVATFQFSAPIYGNDSLEAEDDDLVGPGTDYKEIAIRENFYDESIGTHGRKVVIYQEALDRAEEAAAVARAFGMAGGDDVFNLKTRFTAAAMQRMIRHNELLIGKMLTTGANFPSTHVFATLNVRTATNIRETVLAASNMIEDNAGGPANFVGFGVGARQGAEQNPAFLDLLPENAPKVLTRAVLRQFLTPNSNENDTRLAQVYFPSARTKKTSKAASTPIYNDVIIVARVVPDLDGTNETLARNYWKRVRQNRQRWYTNEISVGVQENAEIGIKTHYKPGIVNKNLMVLIPTTSA